MASVVLYSNYDICLSYIKLILYTHALICIVYQQGAHMTVKGKNIVLTITLVFFRAFNKTTIQQILVKTFHAIFNNLFKI